MERINPTGGSRLKRELKSKRKKAGKAGHSRGTYSSKKGNSKVAFDALFPLEDREIDKDLLEDLLDEIHEAGEVLNESPTLENIKNYRQSVSDFMKYVVKNTLDTETAVGSSFNPLKKQKRYIIIKVINDNLENLAAGILQNQLDQLKILEKIDEINGLIVNLLK